MESHHAVKLFHGVVVERIIVHKRLCRDIFRLKAVVCRAGNAKRYPTCKITDIGRLNDITDIMIYVFKLPVAEGSAAESLHYGIADAVDRLLAKGDVEMFYGSQELEE